MGIGNQGASHSKVSCQTEMSETKGPLDVVSSSISELDVVNVLAAVRA
jgi:hypothetical protein